MGPKQRREKLELVFNAKERADFLTGFSKRKQARKKKARLEVEKQYKVEVARIKKEKRDHIKQRLEEVSSVKAANGIELTKLAEEGKEQEEIVDLPQHTVTITYAEEMDLAKCTDSAYLGNNEDDAVEVIDMAKMEEENGCEETGENKECKPASKIEQRKSANRVANLAKKAQMLKAKKRLKSNEGGKSKKSKKKFLRKKIKSKNRNTR